MQGLFRLLSSSLSILFCVCACLLSLSCVRVCVCVFALICFYCAGDLFVSLFLFVTKETRPSAWGCACANKRIRNWIVSRFAVSMWIGEKGLRIAYASCS